MRFLRTALTLGYVPLNMCIIQKKIYYWLDSSKNVLWLTKSWWMSHLVCRSHNGSHHTKIFFLLKATRKKSLLLHTPHAKTKEYDAFLHVWDVSLHSSCCTRPPPPILPRNCTPGLAWPFIVVVLAYSHTWLSSYEQRIIMMTIFLTFHFTSVMIMRKERVRL